MFSSLEARILTTITYSSLFNHPLTADEVRLRLVSLDQLGDFWTDLPAETSAEQSADPDLEFGLNQLVEQKRLAKDGRHYFPRQFILTSPTPFHLRAQKERWTKQLRQDLKPLKWIGQKCGWIKAMAVTGSAALNSAWKDDDIDLMVVTKTNRLWLARTVLLIWSLLKGRKKILGSSSKQAWCFNLWLSEEQLAMNEPRQSLYTAFEVCQADWFYQTEQIEKKFLQANSWVKNYVPIYFEQKLSQANDGMAGKAAKRAKKSALTGSDFFDLVLSSLNKLIYGIESKYINFKLKIPQEHLKLNQAFFHKKASSQEILIRLKNRLRELQESS